MRKTDTNNVVDKMITILRYYQLHKRVGHSTALLKGTNNIESIMVYHDNVSANKPENKERGFINISLSQLPEALRGQNLPLVLEHSALEVLLNDAINLINELQSKLELNKPAVFSSKRDLFDIDKFKVNYNNWLKDLRVSKPNSIVCKLRTDTVVCQDHHFGLKWPNKVLFRETNDVAPIADCWFVINDSRIKSFEDYLDKDISRLSIDTFGFGVIGVNKWSYGCGGLAVNKSDVVEVSRIGDIEL